MLVEILDPEPGEIIIDPACGSGGFLIGALEHVWAKIERNRADKGWTQAQVDKKKRDVASRCFRGLDKDAFLTKVTKAYMAIIGDGRGGIFCENSLKPPSEWQHGAQGVVDLGRFDVVLTNPPFGTKIKIKGTNLISQFDLGYKWRRKAKTDELQKTSILHEDQPPQILFLERCLQLLKPGGRLGIVLPESILGNPSYEHVVTYLLKTTRIQAVITMPESLFKTSGKGGTHTKVCVLVLQKVSGSKDYRSFMADVKWCGHDSRGNPTIRRNSSGEEQLLDEVSEVAPRFRAFLAGQLGTGDHRGFSWHFDGLQRILVPKYYNPEIANTLSRLAVSHEIVTMGSLVENLIVSIGTGIEIGKMAYGTGTIPFIRTSDLSNWEIKADFKHGISEKLYREVERKVDVRPDDILLVRDGTYLIGTTAMVTASDVPMLFQSHIYRIRVLQPDRLDPWLLFIALNTPVVKQQIWAKQFTQDIIDTLGQRILELQLPLPKDLATRRALAESASRIVTERVRLREQVRQLPVTLQGQEIDDADVDVIS